MSRSAIATPPGTTWTLPGALNDSRHAFWSVAVFSCLVSLLMFAGPFYLIQVYDRVLASRSVATLIALFIGLVGAFAFQLFFDLVRSGILAPPFMPPMAAKV